MSTGKRGLGRGLSALLENANSAFGEAPTDQSHGAVLNSIALDALQPNKLQPRRRFDGTALQELAESIRKKGIVQPIIVRPSPNDGDRYEIIAGERRWRAARLAGLREVSVIIHQCSDRDAAEAALVENLQRLNLLPLEEAEGYKNLQQEFNYSQGELADAVGKSRSHVANMIRLLGLPEPVKLRIEDGTLSVGHARALLNTPSPEALAAEVVANGLSVRQTERLAKRSGTPSSPPAATKTPDVLALERDLSTHLGMKVAVTDTNGRGKIALHYTSLEELENIVSQLVRMGTGSDLEPSLHAFAQAFSSAAEPASADDGAADASAAAPPAPRTERPAQE